MGTLLLTFAVALLVAVMLSQLASRSVLSTSVIFLAVGAGVTAFGVAEITPDTPAVAEIVEVALFAVLFTDALQLGARDLASAWRLPGRALLFGMPLTFALVAALAHLLVGLPWTESFLIGAVLAPTDPVLSSAIVGREGVPARLRRLLNVESGVNDGLALPVVLLLIAASTGDSGQTAGAILSELGLGIAIGVAIPYVAILLLRLPTLSAAGAYEPLHGFAIALTVFAVAKLTHGNLFLAAFAAGVTVATGGPEIRNQFHEFGEVLTELLKLLALLLFGALVSFEAIAELGWGSWLFALFVLVVARPVAIGISLIGSEMDRWERGAAAWFGPKGFASVVYALLVLHSSDSFGGEIFTVAALVISGSIIAHSSTDVLVARLFREGEDPTEGLIVGGSGASSGEEAAGRGDDRSREAEEVRQAVAAKERELDPDE